MKNVWLSSAAFSRAMITDVKQLCAAAITDALPLHEQIIDRLIPLLLEIDDLLEMMRRDPSRSMRQVENRVQRAADEIDHAVRSVSN